MNKPDNQFDFFKKMDTIANNLLMQLGEMGITEITVNKKLYASLATHILEKSELMSTRAQHEVLLRNIKKGPIECVRAEWTIKIKKEECYFCHDIDKKFFTPIFVSEKKSIPVRCPECLSEGKE